MTSCARCGSRTAKPGGPSPAIIAKPYTLKDVRDRLAEVSGDRRFADDFFDKYIEGRELPDYEKLFARVGLVLRKRNAGGAWVGLLDQAFGGGRGGRRGGAAAAARRLGGSSSRPRQLGNTGVPGGNRRRRRHHVGRWKSHRDDRGLAGSPSCPQARRFHDDRIHAPRFAGEGEHHGRRRSDHGSRDAGIDWGYVCHRIRKRCGTGWLSSKRKSIQPGRNRLTGNSQQKDRVSRSRSWSAQPFSTIASTSASGRAAWVRCIGARTRASAVPSR